MDPRIELGKPEGGVGASRDADVVPVEVVFGGRAPDRRTLDLCVEAARSLAPHSRRIEACEVRVSEGGGQTEVVIDVRTAEGEVLVDRFTTDSSEAALRETLRSGFAQVARGMERAQEARPDHFPPESGPIDDPPPPCTYIG